MRVTVGWEVVHNKELLAIGVRMGDPNYKGPKQAAVSTLQRALRRVLPRNPATPQECSRGTPSPLQADLLDGLG